MKKKLSIILLILTALVGSVVTFYSVNLLMSDLSNMFYGVHDAYFISSIPLFVIAVDFVLLYIFLLRYTRYPMYKKAMLKLYTTFLLIFSIIGIVASIITGAVIYKSFFKPYPFGGCTLICLFVHALLLAFAIFVKVELLKTMENDAEKKKIQWHYALYSGVIFALVLYAFNKFGGLLLSPIFIQWSTFNLTFPFYISLASPMALLVHITLYFLDIYKGHEVKSLVIISTVTTISISVSVAVMVLGSKYPEFISAVSACLPLERLATSPIGTVAQFFIIVGFGLYYVIYAIKSLIIRRRKEKEAQ